MKDSLTSLDVHYLVKELQVLAGSRLDKVYQAGKERKGDMTFQLRKKDAGKLLLRLVLPGFACLVAEKPAYPPMPGYFAVFLRKHLGNATLNALRQRDFERIIEIEFQNKNGIFTLIVELLPPGNALLLNSDGKIINLLQPQRHGQRLLRGGAMYEPPPPVFNTKDASAAEILDKLAASEKDSIVKAVAIDLSFGGVYAEEVCARADVDKSLKLPKNRLEPVVKEVKDIFKDKLKPFLVEEHVYPFAMRTKKGEGCESFSEGIAQLIPEVETAEQVEEAVQETKQKKTKNILEQQTQQLEGYRKSSEENQKKGEMIYSHYQDVKKILDGINKDRKKLSWKEVKEKYPNVAIDENKGKITIELE